MLAEKHRISELGFLSTFQFGRAQLSAATVDRFLQFRLLEKMMMMVMMV